MREGDGWPSGERDVGGDPLSPDEHEGAARPVHDPAHRERHLARTLEDVSHLFLSKEDAGGGVPDESPRDSAWQTGKENERLRRALADLTVDHLIVREAAKSLERLERENELLRRAVTDLTLDNLLLKDAARGNS